MQTTNTLTTTYQQVHELNVANPHIVLGGLIDSMISPCNCGHVEQHNEEE